MEGNQHVGFQWSFHASLEEACCWSVSNPKIVRLNDQASINVEICYRRQAYILTDGMLLTCYSNQTTGVEFQSTVFDPYDPSHYHQCVNRTDVMLLPLTEPVSTTSSPMSTNSSPMSTNSSPMSTNSSPMSTNSSPMSTNSSPMSTNSSPMSTNSSPMSTSSSPMSTTSTSTSTNSLPMSTNSSSMSTSSSSSSSSITVEPTSSASFDLMCNDSTGVWPLTKAGSNVTISGVCYNGTVDGKK